MKLAVRKVFCWCASALLCLIGTGAVGLGNMEGLNAAALINSGGTTLNSHAYQYDLAGRRTRQTWASASYVNYGYDTDSQLQSAVGGGGDTTSLGYKYDSAWNLHPVRYGPAIWRPSGGARLEWRAAVWGPLELSHGVNTRTNSGATTSFTVDTQNQLTGGPGSPYSYDNNGNLTAKQNGNFTYSYDADNRLTTVTYTATFQTTFAYDGLGRLRVRQEYNWNGSGWVLASTTWYLYDGRRVIQERDGSNTPTVSYTRGADLSGGLEGAGGIGGLLARSSGYSGGNWSTHYYYHADGNGSITYVMDSSQGLGATYRYDPYGNVLSQSGPLVAANVYQFSSKEWHSKSGLFYYGFRFYDPNLQRWMNRDPIGETGGINLYRLTGNDPIGYVDPLGLALYDYIPGIGPGIAQAKGTAAINAMLQANGYNGIQDFQQQHPGFGGTILSGNPDAVSCAANITSGSANLYLNGAIMLGQAGIVTRGTQTAAQGIADAAGEGWLSKLLDKCKFWKKHPRIPHGSAGPHIALGLRQGLRDFARDIGANHLLDDPAWKEGFQQALADPSSKFSLRLDGLTGATTQEQIANSINATKEGWGGFAD